MSKAIDPFEEYLRKKKVELLERKYREENRGDEPPRDFDEADKRHFSRAQEDPEVEARLEEEMQEFFDAGANAAQELFAEVNTGLSGEEVEEIQEVLEEVFEDDAKAPQEEQEETFVHFFREVEESFGGKPGASGAASAAEEPAPAPADAAEAAEAFGSAAAQEVSSDEPDPARTEEAAREATERLDLREILASPATDEAALRQRVDLLCRLMAKVVDRVDLSESEIIEVLIKSGVEF